MADWTPDFDWLTPMLAVGGSFPAHGAEALARRHGLSAVVDLRAEACDDEAVLQQHGLEFLHLPTDDCRGIAPDRLEEGVAFTATRLRQGRKVLIHCRHGIGRSATLALCVLVDAGLEPMAALGLAKDARPKVSPSEDQYDCWRAWMESRGVASPSFDAFMSIAYRHLVVS